MATILCRTRAHYLIILLAAQSFTARAAVSNATNANTPSFPTFSERVLIDAAVTTVATTATLNSPTDIAFDGQETAPPTRLPTTPTSRPSRGARIPVTSIVVAGSIRAFNGQVYYGDGILATKADLLGPQCVIFDSQGNMHIAESGTGRIRKVDKITGIISTVAGTGYPLGEYRDDVLLAKWADICPTETIFDVFGDIYFCDYFHLRIRKITTGTGIISTVVGNGEREYNGENKPGPTSSISTPTGLALDSQGNLYFTSLNFRIQKLNGSTGLVNTVAGNGVYGGFNYKIGNNVRALDTPIFTRSLAIDSSGDLYFTGEYEDGFIKLTMSTGILTTIFTNNRPVYLFIDGFNNIYYSTLYNDYPIYESELHKYTASNGVSSLLENNLNATKGFYVDASGYIYMPYNDLQIVRKVTPNDNANGTPTPQPTQLTAPPTAPPTRPPVETAPPTRPPVETAPPTRSPVSVTLPPSQKPTVVPTRPLTIPTLRPHRNKPSRAPFKKPPRK